MRFKSLLASAVLGLAALAAAPADAQTKVNFRLDWSIYGTHAPFYLGLERGLFAKEGLDVKIEEGQGSVTVSKLVAQGGDQFGFIDFSTMVRGVEQGMPIKAVMRVVSDLLCVISHADAPIKGPKDLEGKVIAYAPAESSAQAMPALLAANGVDAGKVSVLNPAVGAKNALFLQRRADAIPANVNVQPAQLEAQGAKIEFFRFSDYGVSLMNQGIVVNNDYLAKNPDAVRAFLRGTKAAWQASIADPKAAIDALVKRLPQQERHRDALLRQLQLSLGPALETKHTKGKAFGVMEAKDWMEMQDLLVKHGGLPKAVPADQLFTNAFLPN